METMLVVAIIIILIVFFAVITHRRKTRLCNTSYEITPFPPQRGTYSEKQLISVLLKAGISEMAIFHDLYIKKYNNRFSQIDLVVATSVGILVFEVKDYSGWIFGDGRYQQWTQVLNYGKEKYRFYNPILQNKKHIEDLRTRLCHLGDFPFFNIIVFYGNCELKNINFVPAGTYITTGNRVIEVVNQILNQNENAYFSNKWEIVRILKEYETNGENIVIQNQHIENIREMLGKERIFD
jgi:hypothetical protein